jgi:hypothetical protein
MLRYGLIVFALSSSVRGSSAAMAAATGSRLYRLRGSVVPSLAALSSRALDPFVSFPVPVSHDHKEPGFLSPELTRPACTSSRLDSSSCVMDHLRYGGALDACELDGWHLGLGSSYGVRGFAKAKKIKARKLWLTLIMFTAWLMSASSPRDVLSYLALCRICVLSIYVARRTGIILHKTDHETKIIFTGP